MTYVKDHIKDPTKGLTGKITRQIARIQRKTHKSTRGIEEILKPEQLFETPIDFDEFEKYCNKRHRTVAIRARNILAQNLGCKTYGDIYNRYLEQRPTLRYNQSFIYFLAHQRNAREKTVIAIYDFLNYKGFFQ